MPLLSTTSGAKRSRECRLGGPGGPGQCRQGVSSSTEKVLRNPESRPLTVWKLHQSPMSQGPECQLVPDLPLMAPQLWCSLAVRLRKCLLFLQPWCCHLHSWDSCSACDGACEASGKEGPILPAVPHAGVQGGSEAETPALPHRLPDRKGRQTWKQPPQVQELMLQGIQSAVQA